MEKRASLPFPSIHTQTVTKTTGASTLAVITPRVSVLRNDGDDDDDEEEEDDDEDGGGGSGGSGGGGGGSTP